jgi:hypothetical protein
MDLKLSGGGSTVPLFLQPGTLPQHLPVIKQACKQAELPHCAHTGSSDNHCNIIVPAGAPVYNLHISDGAVNLVIITKQYD